MKSISINNAARAIELTKTFTKAASKFGSPEYLELQAARRDYPDFRVVTVAQKAAKPKFKGLTFEYMKVYIEAHDDAKNSKMATFLMLRGQDAEGLAAKAASADYSAILEWFLDEFPAIRDFSDKRADFLKKFAEEKAKKLAAKAS